MLSVFAQGQDEIILVEPTGVHGWRDLALTQNWVRVGGKGGFGEKGRWLVSLVGLVLLETELLTMIISCLFSVF